MARKQTWLSALGGLILSTGLAASVSAASEKELQVVARSLQFLPQLASGAKAAFGIVVDPTVSGSIDESKQVLEIVERLGKDSRPPIDPSLIEVGQFDLIAGMDVVFVTSGLKNHHPAIFDAASRQGILTVSTDAGCVDAGLCVMWVKAEPSVQIVVHRAAADASQVRFQTAFRMLITER